MGKSARDIFGTIIKADVSKNETEYKAFLKFLKMVYKSISQTDEEILWGRFDEGFYEKIRNEFVILCKDYSYSNFANWVKKNKDLYDLDKGEDNDKVKQLRFNRAVMKIMYEVFQEIHKCDDELLKKAEENYHSLCDLYQRLEERIKSSETLLQQNNDFDEYSEYESMELVEEFRKLEKADLEKRDNQEYIETLIKKIDLLEEILCRNDIKNRKEYYSLYRELKKEWVEKFSKYENTRVTPPNIRDRETIEHVKSQVELDEMEYGPEHVDLVSRCRRELKLFPDKDILKIIKEQQNQIDKENRSLYFD